MISINKKLTYLVFFLTILFSCNPYNFKAETSAEDKLYTTFKSYIISNDFANLKKAMPELIKIKKEKYSDSHPLFYAIRQQKLEAVRIIASEKSFLNIKNNDNQTPLVAVPIPYSFDIFQLLLELGADPNIIDLNGDTLLVRYSTRWGKEKIFRQCAMLLLDYGANPNVVKQRAYSPLAQSIMYKDEEYFDKLIQHNADPNLPYNNGKVYPLDTAITYKRPFFVQKLLLAGADVNLEFETGKRFRRVMRKPEILSLLISAGANINLQDKNGRTPLMYAAESGSKEAIIQLLNVKANITLKDKKGLTALDWLKKSGHGNLETLFK